jgi:signal transduction histidine kinase
MLILARVVPPGQEWYALTGLGAVLAAVYAVGAHGGSAELTWLAPLVAIASTGLLGGLLLVLDGDLEPQPHGADVPIAVLLLGVLCGLMLLVPAMLTWAAAVAVRQRRIGLLAREGGAVAIATAQAVESARTERIRIAAGLRAAVLDRTARVAAAADDGDLDAVLESARSALDAMRGLLSGLRDAPGPERAPQPGIAAIGALCARARQAGRDVRYDTSGTPAPLPADADVSAYRMVELVLAAGTGPVTVRVGYTAGGARLTMTPMPVDPDGALGAGLRARATAAGGTITVDPAGAAGVELPGITTDQEVASSRSG